MSQPLTATNHDRDTVGLNYIYPVFSRRAGGLSVGVNLSVNNACNWRCIYCQVPNLSKGAAPLVDLSRLEYELRFFLLDVQQGGFFERFTVDFGDRLIRDIALSGNGEPTSAKNFAETIDLIGRVANELNVFPQSRFVLITNGSLIGHAHVQAGLTKMNAWGGEVWFKFDSATKAGRRQVSNTPQSVESAVKNIQLSAGLCRTKLQTCVFDYKGQALIENEKLAYFDALTLIKRTSDVRDVLLYTVARPSCQPEAAEIKPMDHEAMQVFADEIRNLGFNVSVNC